MLAVTAGVAGSALAGCLGESDAESESEKPASGDLGDPAAHVDVEVMSIPRPDVDPTIVHIEPGGTVEWIGQGQRNAVVAYHPETYTYQRIPDDADPWQSPMLREGDRFEVTLDSEGVYDYADPTTFCSTHEAAGAVGRIVVGWPDPDAEPALQHDPAELPSRAGTVLKACNERCREMLGD